MYCLTCDYDLRALPEHRCPECGRAFDPSRPDTFARKPPPAPGFPMWAAVAVASYPLVVLTLFLTTWIAAAVKVGGAPWSHDPRWTGDYVLLLYMASMLSLAGLVPYMPACVAVLIAYAFAGRDAKRGRRVALLVVLSIAAFVTMWIVVTGRLGAWLIN